MAEAEDLNPSKCAFESRRRYMKTYRVYANHAIPGQQDFADVEADYFDVLNSGVLRFTVETIGPVRWFGAGGWFTFNEVDLSTKNEPPF